MYPHVFSQHFASSRWLKWQDAVSHITEKNIYSGSVTHPIPKTSKYMLILHAASREIGQPGNSSSQAHWADNFSPNSSFTSEPHGTLQASATIWHPRFDAGGVVFGAVGFESIVGSSSNCSGLSAAANIVAGFWDNSVPLAQLTPSFTNSVIFARLW